MTRFYKKHFKAQLIFPWLTELEKWHKSKSDRWEASSYTVSSVHSGTKSTLFGFLKLCYLCSSSSELTYFTYVTWATYQRAVT